MEENLNKILETTELEANHVREDFSQKLKKKRRIEEAYGAFKGQFDIAERIAKDIIEKYKNGETENKHSDIDTYFYDEDIIVSKIQTESLGNITVITNVFRNFQGVEGRSSIKEGDNTIVLKVGLQNFINPRELEYTISHEIMHQFQQQKLEKINGVNWRSAVLYRNVIRFYHESKPDSFSEYFLYGFYSCFTPEVSANISSVANYINYNVKKTKEEEINGEFLTNLLNFNTTYTAYKEIVQKLETLQPTQEDKEFITKCVTTPQANPFGEGLIVLYNKIEFDIDKFIEQNRKNIIKVCKETISKMQKNIMNYFDTEKR